MKYGNGIKKFSVSVKTSRQLIKLLEKLERNPFHPFNEEPIFNRKTSQSDRVAVAFRILRRKHWLTQQQLAKKLGVTQADISNYEHGRKIIGKVIALRVQELFGVDYYKLLS